MSRPRMGTVGQLMAMRTRRKTWSTNKMMKAIRRSLDRRERTELIQTPLSAIPIASAKGMASPESKLTVCKQSQFLKKRTRRRDFVQQSWKFFCSEKIQKFILKKRKRGTSPNFTENNTLGIGIPSASHPAVPDSHESMVI